MTSTVTVSLRLLIACLVTSVVSSGQWKQRLLDGGGNLSFLQGARFKLLADFVTYNNSLHAYWNPESGNGTCCDGRYFPNCSDPCSTLLRYCFKNYGTDNNISNNENIISDCLIVSTSGLLEPTDYIDYSMPPLTVFNVTTPSSLVLLGDSSPVS